MLPYRRLLKMFIFGFETLLYLMILWAMVPLFIADEG